jgi:hypothetical protein
MAWRNPTGTGSLNLLVVFSVRYLITRGAWAAYMTGLIVQT